MTDNISLEIDKNIRYIHSEALEIKYGGVFADSQKIYSYVQEHFTSELNTLYLRLFSHITEDIANNDIFHRVGHIHDVALRACFYSLEDRKNMLKEIICAGILHDRYSYNRQYHHSTAALSVYIDKPLRVLLTEYDVNLSVVSTAIQYHRAGVAYKDINWETLPVAEYIAISDKRLSWKDGAAICYLSAPKYGSLDKCVDYFVTRVKKMLNKDNTFLPMLYKHRADDIALMQKKISGNVKQAIIDNAVEFGFYTDEIT